LPGLSPCRWPARDLSCGSPKPSSVRIEEAVELQRVEQQPGARRLADDGRDEHLLVLDPAEVAPVADGVAGAHEPEGVLAVEGVLAGGDDEAAADRAAGRRVCPHRVVDGMGQADLHAAERVDHALEAEEVDLDEVVDAQVGQALDGGDRASGSADAVGGVELVVRRCRELPAGQPTAGDLRVGVPRDADQHRLLPVGRDVHEDRRVRARTGDLGAEVRTTSERAGVGPDQQHVLGLAGAVGRAWAGRRCAGHAAVLEVVRQVPVDEVAAGRSEHQDDAEAQRDPRGQPPPPPRRPGRGVLRPSHAVRPSGRPGAAPGTC
jgi:hypothetical protein